MALPPIDMDAGDKASVASDWDMPGEVANAVVDKLGERLDLVDSVTGQTVTVTLMELCGVYGSYRKKQI